MYTHGGLAAIICNSPNVTNCTLKIQYLSVSTTCKFSDFNNPTQKNVKLHVTCHQILIYLLRVKLFIKTAKFESTKSVIPTLRYIQSTGAIPCRFVT